MLDVMTQCCARLAIPTSDVKQSAFLSRFFAFFAACNALIDCRYGLFVSGIGLLEWFNYVRVTDYKMNPNNLIFVKMQTHKIQLPGAHMHTTQCARTCTQRSAHAHCTACDWSRRLNCGNVHSSNAHATIHYRIAWWFVSTTQRSDFAILGIA